MAKIASKIEKLIRTNMALVFLCIISIGVLVLVVKNSGDDKSSVKTIVAGSVSNVGGGSDDLADITSPNESDDLAKSSTQSLALSPLRNMPDSSKFESFTYLVGDSIKVSSKCNDVYYVVIIYPEEIDYRIDLLSSKYNSATTCIKGKSYTDSVDLSGKGLVEGAKYYVVHASQAKKGSWYGPY